MSADSREAGRELDALVAERVFLDKPPVLDGLKMYGQYVEDAPASWNKWVGIPPFSTDISAAWEVVEKMCGPTRCVFVNYEDEEWSCTMSEFDSYYVGATADTAPLAICRAALKALTTPAQRP